MSIVDAHTHPFGNLAMRQKVLERVKVRRDAVLFRWRDPETWRATFGKQEDMTDMMIKDMDEHGVDKAVIMSSIGGSEEEVAKAVRKYPDRLVGTFGPGGFLLPKEGNLPPVDFAELAKQIDYWVKDLGLRGMMETTVRLFTSESAPDKIAKAIFPLMEILAKYHVPVMFHTAWTQFGTPIYHGMPLFADDLAERFPDVPIILTKMGRGYDILFEMCLLVAFKHMNVYFDTVQTRPEHLARAVKEIGADRIMFGSDWDPTWSAITVPEDLYSRSLRVVKESGITDAEKEWVLGKTVETLFKM